MSVSEEDILYLSSQLESRLGAIQRENSQLLGKLKDYKTAQRDVQRVKRHLYRRLMCTPNAAGPEPDRRRNGAAAGRGGGRGGRRGGKKAAGAARRPEGEEAERDAALRRRMLAQQRRLWKQRQQEQAHQQGREEAPRERKQKQRKQIHQQLQHQLQQRAKPQPQPQRQQVQQLHFQPQPERRLSSQSQPLPSPQPQPQLQLQPQPQAQPQPQSQPQQQSQPQSQPQTQPQVPRSIQVVQLQAPGPSVQLVTPARAISMPQVVVHVPSQTGGQTAKQRLEAAFKLFAKRTGPVIQQEFAAAGNAALNQRTLAQELVKRWGQLSDTERKSYFAPLPQ